MARSCSSCQRALEADENFCIMCGSAAQEVPLEPEPARTQRGYLLLAAALLLLLVLGVVSVVSNRLSTNTSTASGSTIAKLERNAHGLVEFGRYAPLAPAGEGEVLEWRVLKEYPDSALLLSERGLAARSYHIPENRDEESITVCWASCSLRQWLNGEFLEHAFSSEERKRIICTTLNTRDRYGIYGGGETKDSVFLLSLEDLELYLGKENTRTAIPTEAAKQQEVTVETDQNSVNCGCCYWWLRTPGQNSSETLCVKPSGAVDTCTVLWQTGTVRPALWIDKGNNHT